MRATCLGDEGLALTCEEFVECEVPVRLHWRVDFTCEEMIEPRVAGSLLLAKRCLSVSPLACLAEMSRPTFACDKLSGDQVFCA